MNRIEILQVFLNLSKSQGTYGRVLEMVESMDDEQAEFFWSKLEEQNFTDAVDVVLFFET
jgi:hypothetical protein